MLKSRKNSARCGLTVGLASLLLVLAAKTPVVAGDNEWTVAGSLTALVNVVVSHSQMSSVMYAGTEEGVYRSGDGGGSWQHAGGLPGQNILSLAVDAADGEIVYAGSNSGLYITSNGGSDWRLAPDPGGGILSLATGLDGLVIAGTLGRGVFISTDEGATWNAGSELLDAIVFDLSVSNFDTAVLYAGTSVGLYTSRDRGLTWDFLGAELDELSVRAVVASADDPTTLFVGTFGAGVLRSSDGGENWTATTSGLDDLAVRALAVARADEVLYAATSTGGFFRSTDAGTSWRAVNDGLPSLNGRSVHVHPDDVDRVFGAGPGNGVFEISFAPEPLLRVFTEALDFGSVPVGEVARIALTIENAGSAQLEISSLTTDASQPFSVDVQSLAIPAESSASVELIFVPQQGQEYVDVLTIRSDSPSGVEQVPLSGIGTAAQLQIEPRSLNFGTVPIGTVEDMLVVFTNDGNAPIRIENLVAEDISFSVLSFEPTELAPGELLSVPVRFQPLIRNGTTKSLTVHTDLAGQPPVQVTLHGTGTAPDLTISSRSLEFGAVHLGRDSRLPLEISNSGNADLSIRGLALDGDQFRVEDGPTTEEPIIVAPGPGEEKIIEVIFLPLLSGTHTGTLAILSDAPGPLARIEVDLEGNGGGLDLNPRAPVAVGLLPADLVVADLDFDGNSDLAVADSGGVQVLLNDGAGAFTDEFRVAYPRPSSSFAGWDRLVAIEAASVFGGAPDLIIADSLGQTVSILTNDGTGHFDGPRRDIFIGHQVTDVIAVDVDSDGDLDIAVTDGDAPTITVLVNNDAGSFNARLSHVVQFGPSALVAGNINADGHSDLVVANRLEGTVSVLLSDQKGGFLPRQDVVSGFAPVELAIVDFDADGDNDILSANMDSRDIAVLGNRGDGILQFNTSIQTGMRPFDLAVSDLTADIFSDLTVAGDSSPYLAFLENDGGGGFTAKGDILMAQAPVNAVAVADLNQDGNNDVVALSGSARTAQVFINSDTRRLDPPRPPSPVRAEDVPRDLGRQILVSWEAPELDEQLGRTTEYTIFRSSSAAGPFAEIGTASAGQRQFTDRAATLADTFFYFTRAGSAGGESVNSDTIPAVSRQAPFFELELVNEPRISVGDTLKVRAFLTPAPHAVAGASLYLTFDDSSLTLIDANVATKAVVPFRVDTSLTPASIIENQLQPKSAGKINVALAQMSIPASVEPVALGEIWFRTRKDRATSLTIDNELELNRQSAVVEALTGDWILPFISPRPTQVAIRDFLVRGTLTLEGRAAPNLGLPATFVFVDSTGASIESAVNDEDRQNSGIQHTLNATGAFALAQIPAGEYRIFARPRGYLAGQVTTDSVTIGDSLSTRISLRWVKGDSTISTSLGAGDATADNRIDLADYGVLVRYFGVTSSDQANWPKAQAADFNGDNVVNMGDFFMFAQNFGEVGMGFGIVNVPKVAPSASRVFVTTKSAETPNVLRGIDLGPIVGYSVVVTAGNGRSSSELAAGLQSDPASGTAFHGRDLRLNWWPQDSGFRIVAALRDPTRPVDGDGDLLRLPLNDAISLSTLRPGAHPLVSSVAILRPDGSVEHPQLVIDSPLPIATALQPNFPNPFNPATTISFSVGAGQFPSGARVRLEIFDILGQRIETLVSELLPPGTHAVEWNGRDDAGRPAASGLYIYRLKADAISGRAAAGSFELSRKLLLVR